MPMKSLLSLFIFLCLVLSGTQDMVNTDVLASETNSRTCSIEETVQNPSVQTHHKRIFHFPLNCEFIQTSNGISCEQENNVSSFHVARMLNRFHCDFLLKDFNTKQKTSELLSSFQIVTNSSLHFRFAHLIYLLRKIVI